MHKNQDLRKPRFYYGWVIVFIVALASFTQSAETFPVLGVFLKPMTEDFGWSRSVFTGSMTIGTLLGGVIALGVGPLIDRFGPRWTLVLGFLFLGASLLLLAWINSLWQFYSLQIVGRMMSMGVIALATQVIIPKWFITKRGRAVALGQLGGRLGNAVTPLYVQYLVARGNWRVATAVCGIVVWSISLLPSALFLRRRPEDMGLKPDGIPISAEIPAGEKRPENLENQTPNSEISFSVREAVRFSSFYLLVTAIALSSFSTPALHLHMIPYMTDRGISDASAVSVVALSSVSGALGSLTFGLLAEKFTARLMMVLGFALLSSSFILLLFVDSTILALIWGIHLGIAQGGSFTLQQVIFADYYGRDSLGAIRGIVWPIQMVFNSIGPLVAALAYDTTGDYRLIFFVFAILAIVSSGFLFLARPPMTVGITKGV
ncbi:MFS transporter [SAR202 cluster bacterium AD-802-E10_MRT_200m]|nr:MFS transporter [SAR202 cluster bacterium AD-802-E10_MRT_200m]